MSHSSCCRGCSVAPTAARGRRAAGPAGTRRGRRTRVAPATISSAPAAVDIGGWDDDLGWENVESAPPAAREAWDEWRVTESPLARGPEAAAEPAEPELPSVERWRTKTQDADWVEDDDGLGWEGRHEESTPPRFVKDDDHAGNGNAEPGDRGSRAPETHPVNGHAAPVLPAALVNTNGHAAPGHFPGGTSAPEQDAAVPGLDHSAGAGPTPLPATGRIATSRRPSRPRTSRSPTRTGTTSRPDATGAPPRRPRHRPRPPSAAPASTRCWRSASTPSSGSGWSCWLPPRCSAAPAIPRRAAKTTTPKPVATPALTRQRRRRRRRGSDRGRGRRRSQSARCLSPRAREGDPRPCRRRRERSRRRPRARLGLRRAPARGPGIAPLAGDARLARTGGDPSSGAAQFYGHAADEPGACRAAELVAGAAAGPRL